MKSVLTKISFITLIAIFLGSCDAVKRVPSGKYLLEKNEIYVDSSITKDAKLESQLFLQPNTKLLSVPFRLHIYNLANKDKDSSYRAWLNKKPNREKRLARLLSQKQVNRLGEGLNGINEWIKRTGEAPSIIEDSKIKKSINRLRSYYWNNGWFNIEADYEIIKDKKQRASVKYFLQPKNPYFIDTVNTVIDSKIADFIYNKHKDGSLIVKGDQFNTNRIEQERERLTTIFRNSGLFNFEKEFIKFDADTVNTNQKVQLNLLIQNRPIAKGDSTERVPFKVHKINRVNIFTDYSFKNRNKVPKDSVEYNGYHIYAYDKIKYTKKAITNAVLITPGEIFRDSDRVTTYNQINNLKSFKYPNIRYDLDIADESRTNLIANVLLTPRKKYSTNLEFDLTTSNIQAFGIGFRGSFQIRNVFRGAELLEISGRGSIGASGDAVDGESRFFDISEVGVDFKLSFPKILFPLNTNKIIPKYMSPTTNLIFGINGQQNIGLDRQNASGIFNYQWKESKVLSHQLDIVNIQYVRNLNTNNYFNVYRSSFSELNEIATSVLNENSAFFGENGQLEIPGGAQGFINQSLSQSPNSNLTSDQIQEISILNERKERLTEDNLILATNYTYTKNNRENLYDEDFSRFQGKIEFAGNVLNGLANLAGLKKNANDNFDVFGVEFSQYAKLELDYIKRWDLGGNNIMALRSFGGIAIPYGNANSIPFVRSFFAGGPNDNRAWLAYDLGPGSSGGRNEFNEANMKLALNLEYRYKILGSLKGAFFIDAGNIWNVLDNVEDEDSKFSGFGDLQEIAVGTGFGLRYDFDFFVVRFDIGFKNYNPANGSDNRWFNAYNFSKAVYNVGINYPF